MARHGYHDCFDVQSCEKATPCACGEVRGHLWRMGGVRVNNVQHRLAGEGHCYLVDGSRARRAKEKADGT